MHERKADAIRKTFVLGAGFSANAGFPLVRDLRDQVVQLAHHLPYKVFLQPGNMEFEKGQFFAGLETVDPDDSLQFEELLIALLDHLKHPKEIDPCHVTLMVLRNVCARLLWNKQDSIQKVSSCYENFAHWVSSSKNIERGSAIVSFNWDLLAEKALSDSSIPWSYSNTDDSRVSILKPHGSISWSGHLRKNRRPEYSGWQPIGPTSKLSYDAFNPLSNPDRDDINPDLRYMIFPGDPESAEEDVDQQLIWNWAAKAIEERESIVFIGYSLPVYDSFSVEFFSHLSSGKIIEAYNPSKEHLENFRRVFGSRAILKPLTFEGCHYAQNPD